MELELVSFKQASALSKLGFPQGYDFSNWNMSFYDEDGIEYADCQLYGDYDFMISAPTLELVAKWLREEKNIYVDVIHHYTNNDYALWVGHEGEDEEFTGFTTHEEALIAGIDKAIEILKKK